MVLITTHRYINYITNLILSSVAIDILQNNTSRFCIQYSIALQSGNVRNNWVVTRNGPFFTTMRNNNPYVLFLGMYTQYWRPPRRRALINTNHASLTDSIKPYFQDPKYYQRILISLLLLFLPDKTTWILLVPKAKLRDANISIFNYLGWIHTEVFIFLLL